MEKIYRQWVDDYQDQAWSLARYLLQDPREAEDATQEAFIKLWQHRESIDPLHVRPWLMRVTRNKCLDKLRRRQQEVEFDDSHPSSDSGPMEGLQRSETGRWLRAAISRLAEPFRSLVILRDVQQHSYEEVAGVTGLSLPQVKTYLHRARKQLREQLLEVHS
jgi:RNA polymerase sigma-70 factor (ECF subfamily)